MDRLWSDEKGQAVAEFSLVVVLLVFILFSILEFGLMLNAKLVVLSSVREIARVCAVEGGNTGRAQEKIRHIIENSGLEGEQLKVSISPTQAIYGTTINVFAEYAYPVKSPVVAALIGPSINLSCKAVTRSEFVPR